MNALNSIFIVLLVILIGFGGFGYLYNEYQDLRQENETLRQTIAGQNLELGTCHQTNAVLSQDNENCILEGEQKEVRIKELEDQVAELGRKLDDVQPALVECQAELENTTQFLDACIDDRNQTPPTSIWAPCELDTNQTNATDTDSRPGLSNQAELSTPEQLHAPQLAAMAPQAIVLLATGIGGVAVIVGLIFRTKVHKLQDVPQPIQFSAAPRTDPKQVTVKMNHQAYQSYLDYLKSNKK